MTKRNLTLWEKSLARFLLKKNVSSKIVADLLNCRIKQVAAIKAHLTMNSRSSRNRNFKNELARLMINLDLENKLIAKILNIGLMQVAGIEAAMKRGSRLG